MTAEVAIINKQAIALAADSAVTVNVLNERKIYNSANKLFALSSRHPVGIMIYGNAQLTGVPWETLIKVYRKKLGDRHFPKLSDYCEDFIAFLTRNTSLFREEDQILAVQLSAYNSFSAIKAEIHNKVKREFVLNGRILKRRTNEIVTEVIDKFYVHLNNLEVLPCFSKNDQKEIISKYRQCFEEILPDVFDELKITRKSFNKLLAIAANSLIKNTFSTNISGIVIAGFGEEEVLPELCTYDIECVFDGKLKYQKNYGKSYDGKSNAVIIPFAQEEMIFTFVTGIDPEVERMAMNLLDEMLKRYSAAVLDAINPQSQNNQQILANLEAITEKLVDQFRRQTNAYREKRHIAPIVNMVSMLPKDELGAMAEALVSLTSLKRRVSTDAETVGGPTDVALISKGDGFVWVRRKHYFDPEINPDFFANKIGSVIASYKGGDSSGS